MRFKKVMAGILAAATVVSLLAGTMISASAAQKKTSVSSKEKTEYTVGKLQASNDLRGGKVTTVRFNFRPKAATGSSIELQDPGKTYSLYEVDTTPKSIRKYMKHIKKYRKIATLRYYDAGEHVKGLYSYQATVHIKRNWRPMKYGWYKFVVREDGTGKRISNVVKLAAIKELDKCDCADCCCNDCKCGSSDEDNAE